MSEATERVRRHRRKLREAGLRPIQLWVPDTRNPKFREECRRQSRRLRDDPDENEMLAWIEQAADLDDWE
ncbi:antitoxin MazE family protein [Methylomarinovum tepidoasis]|nr:antitoxin MazE family protein [Methylomarinovum sp. IN45]